MQAIHSEKVHSVKLSAYRKLDEFHKVNFASILDCWYNITDLFTDIFYH